MSDMPAPAYKGTEPYIFISYAHKDWDLVAPFILALQKDYRVWYDEGIRYGAEWTKEIVEKLAGCSLFLFMISGNSLVSENCADEIYSAREQRKNFINILLDPTVQLPDDFSFRYGRYQMCKIYTFSTIEESIADLSSKCDFFDPCLLVPKAPTKPAPKPKADSRPTSTPNPAARRAEPPRETYPTYASTPSPRRSLPRTAAGLVEALREPGNEDLWSRYRRTAVAGNVFQIFFGAFLAVTGIIIMAGGTSFAGLVAIAAGVLFFILGIVFTSKKKKQQKAVFADLADRYR